MKIEKINDNSIKCTLNKQDLSDRELHLSELAYGSEKAKALFSELLLQASYECGFEAQDTPLMIEAVPMSKDSLVLILTKVADPEELNVSYSKINLPAGKPVTEKPVSPISGLKLDDAITEAKDLSLFFRDKDLPDEKAFKEAGPFLRLARALDKGTWSFITRAYRFDTLNKVIKLANVISPAFKGENTLYKTPGDEGYLLSLSLTNTSPQEFNKVCNVCAEYGETMHTRQVSNMFFEEHYEAIIKNKALQKLRRLNKH